MDDLHAEFGVPRSAGQVGVLAALWIEEREIRVALTRTDLLILDDWGPDRLTAPQRRDLMEIVEDRYGRGSTLITSQLPVDKWHDIIDEPTFADAILDRLVQDGYRLALGGPSLRNPEVAAAEPATVDVEAAGSKTITHTKLAKGAKK